MVVVQKIAPYRLTFSLRNFPIKNDKIKISRFMCQTFSIYVSSYNDATNKAKKLEVSEFDTSSEMVAGAGFEPTTFGL